MAAITRREFFRKTAVSTEDQEVKRLSFEILNSPDLLIFCCEAGQSAQIVSARARPTTCHRSSARPCLTTTAS